MNKQIFFSLIIGLMINIEVLECKEAAAATVNGGPSTAPALGPKNGGLIPNKAASTKIIMLQVIKSCYSR